MLKKILLVLIFVFPFVGSVQAADITHMSLDPGTCWLKERGVAVKENPISITGKKTEHGCLAFIPEDTFDRHFNFCVYSGFEMVGGDKAAYYGCSFSKEKDSYMFRAYMSYEGLNRRPGLICNFMCYNK